MKAFFQILTFIMGIVCVIIAIVSFVGAAQDSKNAILGAVLLVSSLWFFGMAKNISDLENATTKNYDELNNRVAALERQIKELKQQIKKDDD